MAATVEIDKLADAELDYSAFQTTRLRTATIRDLDTSAPSLVLENAYVALTAIIPFGSGYPSNPGWRLARIRIIPTSGSSARAIMIYQTPQFGVTSVYLIRDSTSLTSVSRQTVPGTLEPIRVSYKPDTAAFSGDNPIISDSITCSILTPVRSLQITQISFGAVPPSQREAVGTVNNDTFLDADPGWWLCSKYESDISRWSGSYQTSIEVSRKRDEDWSQVAVLQDRQTGRYANITADVRTAVKALPYSKGIIYPTNPLDQPGVVRFGAFDAISFGSLLPGVTL